MSTRNESPGIPALTFFESASADQSSVIPHAESLCYYRRPRCRENYAASRTPETRLPLCSRGGSSDYPGRNTKWWHSAPLGGSGTLHQPYVATVDRLLPSTCVNTWTDLL